MELQTEMPKWYVFEIARLGVAHEGTNAEHSGTMDT